MADIQEAYPTFSPTTQPAPLLLADFDTISLSQLGYAASRTLEFAITDDHNVGHSLTETYFPVDYETTIHDVRELLRPYFQRSDIAGLTDFSRTGLKNDTHQAVHLTIRQYDGPAVAWEQSYDIVYTDIPTGYIHTGIASMGSRFLLRDRLHKISADQPSSVSFFAHGEVLKVKMYHYVNGTPELTDVADISVDNSNLLKTYNFTLEDLASTLEIDVNDAIYVDIQLLLGQEEQDSVRFMHDRGHRVQRRTFAFIGAMGEPEFVAMTGRELREAEFEGTFLMEHNNYRKANTKLNKIHTSYTGPLTEGGRDLIWDMAASPWVYTIEDGQLVEVTITEVGLTDSSPHAEPIGLSVKWRYADEYLQRTFIRMSNTPHLAGVFDETFDETFE